MGCLEIIASPPHATCLGDAVDDSRVFGCYWPPMHQRAVPAAGGGTLTDTLHIVWTIVTGLLFVLETGFGAASFGKGFRAYSIVTIAIVLACGAVTGTYAADIQANLATPWAGVWERLSTAAYMLWIAVLAIALLRARRDVPRWGFGALPETRHTNAKPTDMRLSLLARIVRSPR